MRLLAILLLFSSLFVCQSAAQILGARTIAATPGAKAPVAVAVAKPATGPTVPPATFGRRETLNDGSRLTKQVITFARGQALEIDLPRLTDWKLATSPQYQVLWTHWFNPQVRLGINRVTGPAAHALLAGSAWSNAPTLLTRDAKDMVRVVVNDDSDVHTTMIRLGGWRTRVYQCEITSAIPGVAPQGQVLVAAGDDTQAYLFSLEGPLQQVNALQSAFEGTISWLEPVAASAGGR